MEATTHNRGHLQLPEAYQVNTQIKGRPIAETMLFRTIPNGNEGKGLLGTCLLTPFLHNIPSLTALTTGL